MTQPPVPGVLRSSLLERPLSRLEKGFIWYAGWGDGRGAGPVYFFLNRQRLRHRRGFLRLARGGAAVAAGAFMAVPWTGIAEVALAIPPLVFLAGAGFSSYQLTRRLVVHQILPELAMLPAGMGGALRDVHLSAVPPTLLACCGWVVGHILPGVGWAGGFVPALILALLLIPVLWRASLAGSLIALNRSGTWRIHLWNRTEIRTSLFSLLAPGTERTRLLIERHVEI